MRAKNFIDLNGCVVLSTFGQVKEAQNGDNFLVKNAYQTVR